LKRLWLTLDAPGVACYYRSYIEVWGLRERRSVEKVVGHAMGAFPSSPRQVAEWIAKLMFWCGEDKIIYGSETPIWHPKWALDAFWNFEIPQDLVEGYGYLQLTEQAARGSAGVSGGELASTSETLKTKAIAESVCKEVEPLCKLL
jgi:hypothetical protein